VTEVEVSGTTASEGASPIGIPGSPEYARFKGLVALDAKHSYNDQISQEEREWLRSKEIAPHWLNALRDLRGVVRAQFSEKQAEALEFQEECYAEGPSGKSRWYAYKRKQDR
jgi:hypothetical protein